MVIAACDDEVLPLQARIERVSDQAELDAIYTTERHLLYVASTRARDHLLVTGVEPASEFLDDHAQRGVDALPARHGRERCSATTRVTTAFVPHSPKATIVSRS